MLLTTYKVASLMALPFFARMRVGKLRRAGLDLARAHEVLGHASRSRPLGPLIWIHAASVGEAKSSLVLIETLQKLHPGLHILLTTTTPTAAEVITPRLPDGARHQFVPLDGMGPVRRFLSHWRPDLAIFIESEIWPTLIREAERRQIPLALINARLSDRSFGRWKQVPQTAQRIFGAFGILHCQNRRTAAALALLGLRHARRGMNLKSIVPPPDPDALSLARLSRAVGERPVWAAVSTHAGEDEIMIVAHEALRSQRPDALMILVPRHPDRAEDIRALCAGHALAQRSRGEDLTAETSIYLADTLGETDLWFSLAPVSCLCGSFGDAGGHTPYEPVAAGSAILHGPHYANHRDAYRRLRAADASWEVQGAQSLATALETLFAEPDQRRAMTEAAGPLAQADRQGLHDLAAQCLRLAGLPVSETADGSTA